MKLTNGESAKIVKRTPRHQSERCDYCGHKIATHNGEFVIRTSSQNYIGYDHLKEVQA